MFVPPIPPPVAVAAASPAPASGPHHVIVEPDWVTPPDSKGLSDAYPETALRLQAAGFVLLRCGVAETGRLTGCDAVQESPAGLGFGEAA